MGKYIQSKGAPSDERWYTKDLIEEAYSGVVDGKERVDLEGEGVFVKAYRRGTIIRIDVKEEE